MTSEYSAEQPSVTVRGLASLLALHKVLMEAKFHPDPDNREIAGSPLVRAMAHDVFDAIVEAEDAAGRKAKAADWRKWRRAPDWVLERVEQYGKSYAHWPKLDDAERGDWVRCAVSPFEIDEGQVRLLIDKIDRL